MNLLEALQAFWNKGVRRVSPEALGMHVTGHKQIFKKSDIETAVNMTEGIHWEGDWIVKDKD